MGNRTKNRNGLNSSSQPPPLNYSTNAGKPPSTHNASKPFALRIAAAIRLESPSAHSRRTLRGLLHVHASLSKAARNSIHRCSTAFASPKKSSGANETATFLESRICAAAYIFMGRRSRTVTFGEAAFSKSPGAENIEWKESTESLDDASLKTDMVDDGVLTADRDSIVQQQFVGVGQLKSSDAFSWGIRSRLASAGDKNQRSSYGSWSQ